MNDIDIHYEVMNKLIIARIYKSGKEVGHAYLIREGDVADLNDIEINDYRKPVNVNFLRWLETGKNYRQKGYGSRLLASVIEFCKNNGIKLLRGKAIGDLSYLIPWYKKYGFTVDDSNKIYLQLT